MEASLAPDAVAIGVEGDALAGDGGVEIGEGLEAPGDDRLVDMDPEGLGGLQLGRVRGQVDEPETLGRGEPGRAVPAGVVERQEDDAVRSRARLAGEEGQDVFEIPLGDAGREMPEALAGGGRDDGGDVEPFEAVAADRHGALAARRPDPPQDRLQANAVLVGGEGLDHRAGIALRFLGDGFGELYGMARPSGDGSHSVAGAC